MVRAKTPTPAAAIAAYRKGASLPELKQKFGVKSKAHLAKILLESEIAAGKLPALSRKVVKAPQKEFSLEVNKKGTIVIPKDAVIDSFKLQTGQKVTAKRHGKKLILSL